MNTHASVVPAGRRCGNHSPATGHTCRLETGHAGEHAFYWAHLPDADGKVGKIRSTWPNTT